MTVFDGTDKFDARLAVLQRSQAPKVEIDAAIHLYERVRTAQAIAASLLDKPTDTAVLALVRELSADTRAVAALEGSRWRSTSTSEDDAS